MKLLDENVVQYEDKRYKVTTAIPTVVGVSGCMTTHSSHEVLGSEYLGEIVTYDNCSHVILHFQEVDDTNTLKSEKRVLGGVEVDFYGPPYLKVLSILVGEFDSIGFQKDLMKRKTLKDIFDQSFYVSTQD